MDEFRCDRRSVFFPLNSKINRPKAQNPTTKTALGMIDRNSMRHKKLVALRKKKGNNSSKGDARLKDEEEEKMRKTNNEAGF